MAVHPLSITIHHFTKPNSICLYLDLRLSVYIFQVQDNSKGHKEWKDVKENGGGHVWYSLPFSVKGATMFLVQLIKLPFLLTQWDWFNSGNLAIWHAWCLCMNVSTRIRIHLTYLRNTHTNILVYFVRAFVRRLFKHKTYEYTWSRMYINMKIIVHKKNVFVGSTCPMCHKHLILTHPQLTPVSLNHLWQWLPH